MNSLETTLSSGRELCPRGKRSGEQSQSVDKPDRRMGRRPEQRTVGHAIRKGLKQASIRERFQAWLAVCLGEPTGRTSQAGRAGLEGTHSTDTQHAKPHNNTTQQTKKHVIKAKN